MKRAFAILLRQSRKAAGVSMGFLADWLGVSVPYVSDVELGNRAPFTYPRILDTARLFNISPLPLIAAASQERAVFELSANVGSEQIKLGAQLVKAWPHLTSAQVEAITRILEATT